ncbi:hypothetical protein FKP32DRAFT_478946 [Trametes sanguinea]|nr:hypothetical protein FKP32DRAFT_478946 [Trametes sanguinea]
MNALFASTPSDSTLQRSMKRRRYHRTRAEESRPAALCPVGPRNCDASRISGPLSPVTSRLATSILFSTYHALSHVSPFHCATRHSAALLSVVSGCTSCFWLLGFIDAIRRGLTGRLQLIQKGIYVRVHFRPRLYTRVVS